MTSDRTDDRSTERSRTAGSLRQNNFDLVRILLAITVVLVHSYDLSARPELAIFRVVLNAHMAVEAFFVISGFLIVASYERSKSLAEYSIKRARRILPGYGLAALFCVSIAACFNPHLNPLPFLLADLSFLTFLHPGIAGVFRNNPANSALDGALWTLKTEVLFYALVPAMVYACRRWGRLTILLSITILSIAFRMICAERGNDTLSLQLPGQMCFFALGTLVYYNRESFQRWSLRLLLISIGTYVLYAWSGFFPLRPVFITVITLYACLCVRHVKGPSRWGDFSYGTYVLHWPIIQSLVALGLFAYSPWLAMAVVLLLVALAAVASWFFVEARWLKRHHSATPALERTVALAS